MAGFHKLHVYHAALQQVRDIAAATSDIRFGDLANQLRRASISVCSNTAEGANRHNDTEFIRLLVIARGSNDEIAAQLDILAAVGGPDTAQLLARNACIGRMLTGLIRFLRGNG